MIFRLKTATFSYLVVVLLSVFSLILLGCNPKSNDNDNSNPNPNSPEIPRTFSDGITALLLIDPPPTIDDGEKYHIRVEEIKGKLQVSSLSEILIVLNPQRNPITVESLQFEIYSNKEKVFSIPALPPGNAQTFKPLERSDPKVVGYVFTLDPKKIEEGEKFFVPGNTIKLTPQIRRENTSIYATFYLVNKKSEETRYKR